MSTNKTTAFSKDQSTEWLHTWLYVLSGITLLALCAQIRLYLPWTPVPVTGQTFAVLWIALLYGSQRATLTVGAYLTMGVIGLPVFASAKAFTAGPTTGYLAGMLVGASVVGHFKDRGWTETFTHSWLAGLLGTIIIFAFGLSVLSFFIPSSSLLSFGLFPFLPGAIIKITLAAALSIPFKKRGLFIS